MVYTHASSIPFIIHARTNAPHVMYNFFLLYIKTTRINYLVKFLSKPPPSFQPSISQIIWIYVCILHNKEKEKISKKLRMSFSNLTFRSWLVLWNPANAWLSTCNHYCTIYSKDYLDKLWKKSLYSERYHCF